MDFHSLNRNFFVTPVLPYTTEGAIDETQYRSLLRRFLTPRFINLGLGLIANPEAGELFYLTRDEKRRVVEITLDEAAGRVPVFAGVIDLTTEGTVAVASDAMAAGVDGLFVMPPIGAIDVTTSWDADRYPEVFINMLHAITAVCDLPMIVHPTSAPSIGYGIGIPADATRQIIAAVPQIVGWKMTYSYDGYRRITRVLRESDRPVAVLGAVAKYFHENLASNAFDGTSSGAWNYALEAMLDHVEAWDEADVSRAQEVWEGGLAALQEYVFSEYSRLHIRYKTACWLRGFINSPTMRAPLPGPTAEEIATLAQLLPAAGLSVIDEEERLKQQAHRLALTNA